METKIKIGTALAIPYAFLCAGMYQLAYWMPFDINGFAYLGVTDIILSFVQPFFNFYLWVAFTGLLTYGVSSVVLDYIKTKGKKRKIDINEDPAVENSEGLWVLVRAIFVFVVYVVFLLWALFCDLKTRLVILPQVACPLIFILLSEYIVEQNFVRRSKLNYLLMYLIFFLPVYSLVSGATSSLKIYEGKEYHYSLEILQSDTLKFVGKASDYYFFVSMDNQKKYIFTTSEIPNLKLHLYSKPN